jgi:hypothetical protein
MINTSQPAACFRNFFGWSDEAQFCPVTANNRIKKTVQPRTRGARENSPCFCPYHSRNQPHFPNFIAPKPGKFRGRVFALLPLICAEIFLVSFLAVAKHYLPPISTLENPLGCLTRIGRQV